MGASGADVLNCRVRVRWAFRVALIAVVVVAAALGFGAPAHAMSRKQADRKAMKVLKTKSKKQVVLFRETRRLRPNDTVTFATRKRVPISKKGYPRVGKRAWLYWQDLAPYAGFEHRSEMLLLDDRTGRVLKRRKLLYYPIVNGKPPRYLRSPKAYAQTRYRVFERLRLGVPFDLPAPASIQLPADGSPSRETVAPTRRPTGPPLDISPSIPEGAFDSDCVLLVGEVNDPSFRRDFRAIARFFRRVGVGPVAYATGRGVAPFTQAPSPAFASEGTPRSLIEDIKYLENAKKCDDILIYVAGHGAAKRDSPMASVTMAGRFVRGRFEGKPNLVPSTIKRVVEAFPKITFKFKIMACYAGRFTKELETEDGELPRNVLVVETATNAATPAYRINNPRAFRQLATDFLERSAKDDEALREKLRDAAFKEAEIKRVANELRSKKTATVPNTGNLWDFTHANIVGMTRYLQSRKPDQELIADSELATALNVGARLGLDASQAWQFGWDKPQSRVNKNPISVGGTPPPDESPPPPAPPPPTCAGSASRVIGSQTSLLINVGCTAPFREVRVNPLAPGNAWSAGTTGSDWEIAPDGALIIRFPEAFTSQLFNAHATSSIPTGTPISGTSTTFPGSAPGTTATWPAGTVPP